MWIIGFALEIVLKRKYTQSQITPHLAGFNPANSSIEIAIQSPTYIRS